jgi:hypothetical protein
MLADKKAENISQLFFRNTTFLFAFSVLISPLLFGVLFVKNTRHPTRQGFLALSSRAR